MELYTEICKETKQIRFSNRLLNRVCVRKSLFSTDAIPSVGEMAQEVGNPQGMKIHFHPGSMRWRWLDVILDAHHRY